VIAERLQRSSGTSPLPVREADMMLGGSGMLSMKSSAKMLRDM
jgi:hypothetical protein